MGENNQIVIELGDLYGEGNVATQIAEAAARRLLDEQSGAAEEFRRRVKNISDEEIRTAVTPIIAQALEEAVQPTNAFGQSVGERTTLREVIIKAVMADLQQATRNMSSSSGRQPPTMLQNIIGNEIAKAVQEDLREAMSEARAQVKAAVEAKGAEILTETITRLAKT